MRKTRGPMGMFAVRVYYSFDRASSQITKRLVDRASSRITKRLDGGSRRVERLDDAPPPRHPMPRPCASYGGARAALLFLSGCARAVLGVRGLLVSGVPNAHDRVAMPPGESRPHRARRRQRSPLEHPCAQLEALGAVVAVVQHGPPLLPVLEEALAGRAWDHDERARERPAHDSVEGGDEQGEHCLVERVQKGLACGAEPGVENGGAGRSNSLRNDVVPARHEGGDEM